MWSLQSTLRNFKELLKLLQYDSGKMKFLIDGFTHGFSIGYMGPRDRYHTSHNIPIKNVGSPTEIWNKVMKEVKMGHYAGPLGNLHLNILFSLLWV